MSGIPTIFNRPNPADSRRTRTIGNDLVIDGDLTVTGTIESDTGFEFPDGTVQTTAGITGTGAANRVAYFTSASVIDDGFFFDGTKVGVGTVSVASNTLMQTSTADSGIQNLFRGDNTNTAGRAGFVMVNAEGNFIQTNIAGAGDAGTIFGGLPYAATANIFTAVGATTLIRIGTQGNGNVTLFRNDINYVDLTSSSILINSAGGARILDTNCVINARKDIVVDDTAKGMVLKSPDGHFWRISVDNAGFLSTADLGTTKPS